jgi:SAM-dependent methyltransferase
MTASPPSALDYYGTLELALSGLTSARGEYRRHFGCSNVPMPPGYCWFKGVVAPEHHPDYAEWACNAATELETRFLSELPRLQPKSALDVGCGNGGLLLRLARSLGSADLWGINFQSTQAQTATRVLEGTSAKIIEADFLEHPFARRFDLVCLIESAFHMPDKAKLCQRLADVVAPGGEVWLLDIVVGERVAATFDNLGREQALFNYVPRAEWLRHFAAHGLGEIEFVDLSRGVAEFLRVSEIDVLKEEYFRPRLAPLVGHDLEAHVGRMVEVATQYRRLSRLLRGGMLQYVLMRFRAPA